MASRRRPMASFEPCSGVPGRPGSRDLTRRRAVPVTQARRFRCRVRRPDLVAAVASARALRGAAGRVLVAGPCASRTAALTRSGFRVILVVDTQTQSH